MMSASTPNAKPAISKPHRHSVRQPRIASDPPASANNSTPPVGYANPTSTVASDPLVAPSIGPDTSAAPTAEAANATTTASSRIAVGTRSSSPPNKSSNPV